MEIIFMLISFFLMIITSTSLTVAGQPSPRFHVETWLPFRNREMDYFPKLFYTSGFDLTETAHLLRAGPLLLQVSCCSVLLDLGNETNIQHCR